MADSNLHGFPWKRTKGKKVPRHTLKTDAYYSKQLPDGVLLKQSAVDKTFILFMGKKVLGRRRMEVVLQWENPQRVFAFLARTWLSGRKFPEEIKKTKDKEGT